MKIAIDLGNKYVKGQTETGERIFFRPVIAATPARRQVFTSQSKNANSELSELESIQVTIGNRQNGKNFYVGKLAERRGELPERVFGKEKYATESAERLIWTALALLVKDNEPIDLIIDFPYGQFDSVKDKFASRLLGKTETVHINGQSSRTITIRSVAEYPQSLVAAYALARQYPDVFAEDDGGYIAVADIGGGTTDIVVFEVIDGGFAIEDGISGTLQHGTHDLVQVIRRRMESETGDIIDADLADRIVEKGKAFYGERAWSFSDEVKQTTANLGALLKSQVNDLFGIRKNRIRAMFWIGGGTLLLKQNLKGFHFNDIFPVDAQWKNVEGCLLAETEPVPTENSKSGAIIEGHEIKDNVINLSSHNNAGSNQDRRESVGQAATDHSVQHGQQQHGSQGSEQSNDQQKTVESGIPKRFQDGARAW